MQRSFSELEYAAKKKVTRRDRFLAEIEAVTPREQLGNNWGRTTDIAHARSLHSPSFTPGPPNLFGIV